MTVGQAPPFLSCQWIPPSCTHSVRALREFRVRNKREPHMSFHRDPPRRNTVVLRIVQHVLADALHRNSFRMRKSMNRWRSLFGRFMVPFYAVCGGRTARRRASSSIWPSIILKCRKTHKSRMLGSFQETAEHEGDDEDFAPVWLAIDNRDDVQLQMLCRRRFAPLLCQFRKQLCWQLSALFVV